MLALIGWVLLSVGLIGFVIRGKPTTVFSVLVILGGLLAMGEFLVSS